MQETIETLLAIDKKAKQVVQSIEEKRENQEEWTKQELAVKKAVKEVQEKARIEKERQKWEHELAEKKNQIEEETRQKIEQMKQSFRENKEKRVNQLVTEITQNDYQNEKDGIVDVRNC